MSKIKSFFAKLHLGNKLKKDSAVSFYASLVSIVFGLVLGFLLLLLIDAGNAGYGMANLLSTGISSSQYLAKTLYKAAPLMMTGLAVGFAFKAGLFNIGAAGQYTMGAFTALYAALIWHAPWWIAILCAMFAGALWGFIPGFFKAIFNVNEVITSIMFNWVAVYFANLLLYNVPAMLGNPANKTAELAQVNPSAMLPKMGLDQLFSSSLMNIGIFIAILFAILAYIIMNKTTFGYELKACGFNKNASVYAGINAKRNIILSMAIAGGFAGIGGSITYLSGTVSLPIQNLLLPMGFNGIPVALLASSNPLGIIISSLFLGFLQVGGEAMQPEFSSEVVNIILAVIIYFSAFALLLRMVITKFISRKKNADSALASSQAGPTEPTPLEKTPEKTKKEDEK